MRWTEWWWGMGLMALLLVTGASLAPLPANLPSPPGEDLTLHLLAWGVLAAWFGQLGGWRVALLLLGYSGAIELIQDQIPFRSGELADVLANALGILIGSLAVRGVGDRWLIYVEGRLRAWMASIRA